MKYSTTNSTRFFFIKIWTETILSDVFWETGKWNYCTVLCCPLSILVTSGVLSVSVMTHKTKIRLKDLELGIFQRRQLIYINFERNHQPLHLIINWCQQQNFPWGLCHSSSLYIDNSCWTKVESVGKISIYLLLSVTFYEWKLRSFLHPS